MHRSPSLILLLTLAASSALAQDDASSLEGVGRISIQGGWRYVANSTFYDRFYSQEGNQGMERASTSHGGPMAVGSFAYGITELVEVGIDLFGYIEQPRLTGRPKLTTAAYGALLGLRFRWWWDIGPDGVVPFLGVLSGPLLATAAFEGTPAKETFTNAWGATAGATFRLNPSWGLSLEYRLLFARAAVGPPEQRLGTFNAGGSWISLGINYTFPKDPTSSRVPF